MENRVKEFEIQLPIFFCRSAHRKNTEFSCVYEGKWELQVLTSQTHWQFIKGVWTSDFYLLRFFVFLLSIEKKYKTFNKYFQTTRNWSKVVRASYFQFSPRF